MSATLVMSLGARIKNMRYRRSMSQSYVAGYLNVSQATISHYENDMRAITEDNVEMLAKLFNVGKDYLTIHFTIRERLTIILHELNLDQINLLYNVAKAIK